MKERAVGSLVPSLSPPSLIAGSLTDAQKRIVDNELRDFVLGGVALEGEKKER